MALLFFCLFFFGKKYLNNEIIYQEMNEQRFQNSQNITLNDTFVFALSSSLVNINQESNDYFFVSIRYLKYENKKLISEVFLNSQNCNVYDWSLTDAQYIELKISEFLCFNTTGIVLDGNFMSQNYSYIDIKYFVNLDGNIVEDNRKLKFLINEAPVVNFQMIDTTYSYNSSFKGAEKFLIFKQLDLIPSSSSIVYMFFNVNEAKYFGENLFGESYESRYDFSMRDYDYYFKPFEINNPYVVNFKFFSSLSTLRFKFTPKSISEYLSELGGFVNLTMILFFAFSNYFNNLHFNYILVKSQIDLINENFTEKLKQNKIYDKSFNINKKVNNKINNIREALGKDNKNTAKLVDSDTVIDLNLIKKLNHNNFDDNSNAEIFNLNNSRILNNNNNNNNLRDTAVRNDESNKNDLFFNQVKIQDLNINLPQIGEENYLEGPSKSADISTKLIQDINIRMSKFIKNKRTHSINYSNNDNNVNIKKEVVACDVKTVKNIDSNLVNTNKIKNPIKNISAKKNVNELFDKDLDRKKGKKQGKLN